MKTEEGASRNLHLEKQNSTTTAPLIQNAAQVGIVDNEESTGPNKENGDETPRGLKMKQDALAQKRVKMSSEL